MTREVHPAVRAVHHVARSVLHHGEPDARASFWRRLFPPRRPRLYDKLRDFGHVLKRVLDVPPSMLSAEDIAAIGTDVNQVVQRAEQEIERNDPTSGEPVESFAATIYTIRARHEQIYRRGAAAG